MKKKLLWDLALILTLLAVGFLGIFLSQKKENGGQVVVEIDGEAVGKYSLTTDATYSLAEGGNLLVIENGEAYISDATCPGGDCTRAGKISKIGQTLVCAPHKLIVRVEGFPEVLVP